MRCKHPDANMSIKKSLNNPLKLIHPPLPSLTHLACIFKKKREERNMTCDAH